jgi:ribosome-associated heat shock protein Hsp15
VRQLPAPEQALICARPSGKPDNVSDDRQRIDKWLWHARIVRTRSAAAALAGSGHVRINGARVEAPAKPVRAGDVVTIALDVRVRVLKVTGFAPRRGDAAAGQALYEDLAPPGSGAPVTDDRRPPPADRERGSGRPTKQERRAIARFTRDGET